MPGLLHPPPSAVHGLLAVKRGGQFSKRVRRLAHLEKSVLELRAREGAPPDDALVVLEHTVAGDDAALCITLQKGAARLRLYAHTKLKYAMWLRALSASSRWHLASFYQLAADAPPLATGDFALVYKAHDRDSRQPVAVKHIHVRGAAHSVPDGPCGDGSATHLSSSSSHSNNNSSSNQQKKHQQQQQQNQQSADGRVYLARMVAREARISRIVDHPNVVRMRDVFEQRGSVHIVMDYLPRTLAHVIAAKHSAAATATTTTTTNNNNNNNNNNNSSSTSNSNGSENHSNNISNEQSPSPTSTTATAAKKKNCSPGGGRFSEEEVANVMAQILSGVAYLHGENIVHRDLKPDNILCDGAGAHAGKVFVCDFGMAAFAPKRPESPSVAARTGGPVAGGNKLIALAKRVRSGDFGGDENVPPKGGANGELSSGNTNKLVAGGGAGGAGAGEEEALSQPMHISRGMINAVRAEVGDTGSEASSAATLKGSAMRDGLRGSGAKGKGKGTAGKGSAAVEVGSTTENNNNSNNNGGSEAVLREAQGIGGSMHRMAFGSGIDRLTLTSAVGAPSYVAPEVVRGHRYGAPVDVWACGVMAFRLLSGRLPFEGTCADDVLRKIGRGEVHMRGPEWHGVSDGAQRFVQGLMRLDPRKRLTAESALDNDWLVSTRTVS